MSKFMELAHSKDVHLIFLAVNKQITNKMQNTFRLIVELSGFIKYSLNKLD